MVSQETGGIEIDTAAAGCAKAIGRPQDNHAELVQLRQFDRLKNGVRCLEWALDLCGLQTATTSHAGEISQKRLHVVIVDTMAAVDAAMVALFDDYNQQMAQNISLMLACALNT
jgi:hypothetical protein